MEVFVCLVGLAVMSGMLVAIIGLDKVIRLCIIRCVKNAAYKELLINGSDDSRHWFRRVEFCKFGTLFKAVYLYDNKTVLVYVTDKTSTTSKILPESF